MARVLQKQDDRPREEWDQTIEPLRFISRLFIGLALILILSEMKTFEVPFPCADPEPHPLLPLV